MIPIFLYVKKSVLLFSLKDFIYQLKKKTLTTVTVIHIPKVRIYKHLPYSRTDKMGFVSGSDRPRPMTSSSEYSEVESLSSICEDDTSVWASLWIACFPNFST